MVAAVVFSFESRPAAALAIAGASAAALGSLKPNIGAFAFAALALACATTSPALRPKRVAALVPVAVAILPVALLWPHLDDPFTVRQCVLAVAGIVALSLVAYTVGCEARPDRRDIVWAAIGTVAVLVFVSLVPILRGTSPSELIDGWLVAPSGTTGTFGPIPAYAWVLIWAPLGVVAAAVVAWWTRTGPPLGERARLLIGVAMVVLGLAIWIALSTPILIRSHTLSEVARGLMVATPFAWVVAVRLRDGPRHPVFLTVLIAALAVLQTLHAYPVAGSQVAWSQILFVIVGGMAIAAGSRAIAAAGAAAYPRMPAWRLLAGIAVVVFGAWLVARPIGDISADYGDAYARGVAPELAGAGRMRLDPERARTLETVTAGAPPKLLDLHLDPGAEQLLPLERGAGPHRAQRSLAVPARRREPAAGARPGRQPGRAVPDPRSRAARLLARVLATGQRRAAAAVRARGVRDPARFRRLSGRPRNRADGYGEPIAAAEPKTEPSGPQISIVLPAYNERESVPIVVARALEVMPQLVVAIRGDRRRRRQHRRDPRGVHRADRRVTIRRSASLAHSRNRGYGAAIRTRLRPREGRTSSSTPTPTTSSTSPTSSTSCR